MSGVPLFDPARQFAEAGGEVLEAVGRVLRSGRYILGEEVEHFEAELASWLGVRFVVGVASGTDALVIALRACGVGPGDEVITTPFTFAATATAVLLAGAVPVFADISLTDFNLDPGSLEGALERAHPGGAARAPLRPPRPHDGHLRLRPRTRPFSDRGRRPGLGSRTGGA